MQRKMSSVGWPYQVCPSMDFRKALEGVWNFRPRKKLVLLRRSIATTLFLVARYLWQVDPELLVARLYALNRALQHRIAWIIGLVSSSWHSRNWYLQKQVNLVKEFISLIKVSKGESPNLALFQLCTNPGTTCSKRNVEAKMVRVGQGRNGGAAYKIFGS